MIDEGIEMNGSSLKYFTTHNFIGGWTVHIYADDKHCFKFQLRLVSNCYIITKKISTEN